jgi:hypothetical protein
MSNTIWFFPNGNTLVSHEGQQQPRLQQAWAVIFAEWLETKGVDPASYLLRLPDGKAGRFFRTADEEWNYEVHDW